MMFKKLNAYLENCDLQLTLKRKGGMITVAILPMNTKIELVPLIITDTPDNLDLKFTETIQSPLSAAISAHNNVKAFTDKAEEERKKKTESKTVTSTSKPAAKKEEVKKEPPKPPQATFSFFGKEDTKKEEIVQPTQEGNVKNDIVEELLNPDDDDEQVI